MFFLLYRDQFLDILYDHADLDCNAFVRSKAVQILLSLVKAQALPIKRYVNSFLNEFLLRKRRCKRITLWHQWKIRDDMQDRFLRSLFWWFSVFVSISVLFDQSAFCFCGKQIGTG